VRFTIDHIVPLAQGGTDNLDNLALACFHCNRKKADKTTAPDPESGQTVSLFNPRTSAWREHFAWAAAGLRIIGLTAIGRATVLALDMNRLWAVNIRAADRSVGRHPPAQDPIQEANDSPDA
jgi:hypothetical protein